MNSLELTIKKILKGYKEKKFTPQEIFKQYNNQVENHEDDLNAFTTQVDEKQINTSLDETKNSIPIAHKDIYSTKGIETTAASNILEGYIPPYDATSVTKLKENNFVTVGKLNCDAFAHGGTGENSDFGNTRNPYAINRTPGGSSSGSAAAVAAGFVPVATATDTGGSIRLPASFTNTVGIKPTYGRVSRHGIIAMTSSTDSIGHFTRTVWDNAYILNITAGHDPQDGTSSHHPVPNYLDGIEKGIEGLTIGYPTEYIEDLNSVMKEEFMNSLSVLENLGANIEEISLPHTQYAINTYYIITPSEISSNLARFDGIRFGHDRSKFGAEAKRRIMMGTFCLSSGFYDAYYLKAQKVRTLITNDFKKAFDNIDAIVAPVSPIYPPKLGEVVEDPIQNYLMDVLTVGLNLAGLPGLSVPAGFSESGLPRGIQIMGDYFSEQLLYRIGYAFEQETKHYQTKPEFKEIA